MNEERLDRLEFLFERYGCGSVPELTHKKLAGALEATAVALVLFGEEAAAAPLVRALARCRAAALEPDGEPTPQ